MRKREQHGTITFRVYPEGRRWHYDVQVWPTVASMREYIRPHATDWRNVIACVLWPINSADRPRRYCLGEVHFCRRHLGLDTITHEATHAALQWARRLNLDVHQGAEEESASPDEERFCEAIGSITQQILHGLKKHNILTT
ncbi:MAG: hypothetical protein EBR82_78575 [Caulobacteraceae bacterium]|nr:hypothetical protein [Caulobacteraceae bacterium]